MKLKMSIIVLVALLSTACQPGNPDEYQGTSYECSQEFLEDYYYIVRSLKYRTQYLDTMETVIDSFLIRHKGVECDAVDLQASSSDSMITIKTNEVVERWRDVIAQRRAGN